MVKPLEITINNTIRNTAPSQPLKKNKVSKLHSHIPIIRCPFFSHPSSFILTAVSRVMGFIKVAV